MIARLVGVNVLHVSLAPTAQHACRDITVMGEHVQLAHLVAYLVMKMEIACSAHLVLMNRVVPARVVLPHVWVVVMPPLVPAVPMVMRVEVLALHAPLDVPHVLTGLLAPVVMPPILSKEAAPACSAKPK
jgi:hypothetical protein